MARHVRYGKALGIFLVSALFLDVGACLPKNYAYNFAAGGRQAVLEAFAQAVFNDIVSTLFPGQTATVTTGKATGLTGQ